MNIFSRNVLILLGAIVLFPALLHSQIEGEQAKGQMSVKKVKRISKRLARERYIQIALGVGYQQVLDTRLARNRYRGPSTVVRLGYEERGKKYFLGYEGTGIGSLGFPAHDESSLLSIRGQGSFTFQRLVAHQRSKKQLIFVGATAMGLFHFRQNNVLANSARNSDLIASLAASGMVRREFRFLKQRMIFNYRLQLPLVTYIRRTPSFATPIDGTDVSIEPIGGLTRIVSELAVDKRLSRQNDNRMRLSYHWDFYHHPDTEIHRLHIAQHSLLFSLLIKL